MACLNVGISLGGAFAESSLNDMLKLVAINCTGLVHMAKRVVSAMLEQGHGKILITSSVSATTPTPFETAHGPSTAFGFSFAESLREVLKNRNITVTALLPGATDSDFHFRAGLGNTMYGDNSWKNDKRLVGRQGIDARFAGVDHVVGGDEATKQSAVDNRTMPETVKAAKMMEGARPPHYK